jgi:hypothetical protein
MSTFLNRLKVYAIGFGIGMVFVFFFFQNRGCSWLPENRVKNSILDRVIVIQSDVASKLSAKGISNESIINLLNDGDVNFKKSKKDGKSKIYFLHNDNVKLYFTLPEESFISEVRIADQPVSQIKNSTSGEGKLIHFPKDDDMVFADTMARVTCQQEAFGMIQSRLILKSLKKNGAIDFAKTDFTVRRRFSKIEPKSLQYLYFNDQKGRRIGAEAIWYKNKISIKQFDLPFETDCQ